MSDPQSAFLSTCREERGSLWGAPWKLEDLVWDSVGWGWGGVWRQSPVSPGPCLPTFLCPAVIEALGVLEPRGSPVPWRDGSLSDLSLTGEEPAPGGSPEDSGSALSTQSTEAPEGLSGRTPKAGGRQDEARTPRRGLGTRLQQLLTPSRRPPASRGPPPELPPDPPPPARRSPMDSLLRPRERPGSTASEVADEGRVQLWRHPGAQGGCQWGAGPGEALRGLSPVMAELSLSGQRVGPLRVFSQ